jgi:hypothetical protein
MIARSAPKLAAIGLTIGLLVLLAGQIPSSPAADKATSSPTAEAGQSPTGPTANPSPLDTAPASSDPLASSPSAPPPGTPLASDRFGLGLLIADRGNARLLIVNQDKKVLWRFPGPASLPQGQQFSADDAFVSPDGRTIVANDEQHQVIDRIDIVSRRVVWQYGHYEQPGSGPGYLRTPDDAYPLANGDIVVADIRNCRILAISPSKQIVRRWGRAGTCAHRPPFSFNNPNGDTPLPDGGLLITEIGGSRVVRLSPLGKVVFDIHVPVRYPSDAQLEANGDVLVVDYSNPGAILRVNPKGHLVWRYAPSGGSRRLDHPSLAIPLPDGTVALNDDFRGRVIVVDPRTDRIVWQYGQTDRPGKTAGHLFLPDGIGLVPLGTHL